MIKVCGITNLSDALAATEYGADALGFNFYRKSKRYIRPEAAATIIAAMPKRCTIVGVFVNESRPAVEEIVRTCDLDIVQLHGEETPSDAPVSVRLWKGYRVEEGFEMSTVADCFPQAEALLLDGPAGAEFGGAGVPFLWRVALGAKRKIVLAGGLAADNVQAAMLAAKPWGVDACSRLESSPGIKDHGKMKEFIRAARAAQVEACL